MATTVYKPLQLFEKAISRKVVNFIIFCCKCMEKSKQSVFPKQSRASGHSVYADASWINKYGLYEVIIIVGSRLIIPDTSSTRSESNDFC